MKKHQQSSLMSGMRVALFLCVVAGMMFSGLTFAQEAPENSGTTTRELVESRLADMKEQLDISEYQWTQVEMILKSGIRERVAISRRYGLEGDMARLGEMEGSEKRALKSELKDSRKETNKRMKRYLDKEKYKEFEAIQEEIYGEMLARVEDS